MRTIVIRPLATTLALAAVTAGCESPETTFWRSKNLAGDWVRPAAYDAFEGDQKEIPKSDFLEVSADSRAEVINKLQTHSWMSLKEEEAEKYVTGKFIARPGTAAYLVRAARFDNSNGGFDITWKDGLVRVRYGCLGPPGNLRKTGLVVLLASVPREVYVEAVAAK
jgi:hypothetical protein